MSEQRPSTPSALPVFRICLQALLPEDAKFAQRLLSNPARTSCIWQMVQKDYDALLVDLRHPESTRLLRERPMGSLIILALAEDKKALPGTMSLRLPFDEAILLETMRQAVEYLQRRSPMFQNRAAARGDQAASPAATGGSPQQARKVGSLFDLAEELRKSLTRERELHVTVGQLKYHLFPQRRVYLSASPATTLKHYQGNITEVIEISNVSGGEDISATIIPKRLDDFLWNLGFHAGAGRLFSWLNAGQSYKISRWPPMLESSNRTQVFRMVARLGRSPATPKEIALSTGATEGEVHDLLNACSLVGCLQTDGAAAGGGIRLVHSAPAPIRPAGAPEPALRPIVTRSLLSKIRTKLGITA